MPPIRQGQINKWIFFNLSRLTPAYFRIFIAIGIIAFYFYLTWDSTSPRPPLSGGETDILFVKNDRFMDWINTLRSAGLPEPYNLQGQIAMPVYGPFTYLMLRPISLIAKVLGSARGVSIMTWCTLTMSALIFAVYNIQRIRACTCTNKSRISSIELALTLLVSFPFLFAFDRGNLEILTFALITWYITRIVLYQEDLARENPKSLIKSCIILGLATCIKPYTLLFILLITFPCTQGFKRQATLLLRGLAMTLIISGLLSLISMAILYHGNIEQGVQEFSYWQRQFKATYIIGGAGDAFFCSPFVAIKQTILMRLPSLGSTWIPLLSKIYPAAAFLIAAQILFSTYQYSSNRNLTITLSAIAFCLLIFPYNANEYKAIYFLLPFCTSYCESKTCIAHGSDPSAKNFIREQFTPAAVATGLGFVLLVNRYGLIGDKLVASMVASFSLLVYPILFLRACKLDNRSSETNSEYISRAIAS